MTTILSIDPGPTESAWLVLRGTRPAAFGLQPNDELLAYLRQPAWTDVDGLVIENIEPRYGLQMGWETLDTARWIGRFQEAMAPRDVELLRRSEILRHLGVVTAPKKGEVRVTADAGIRAALIDRYGGPGGKAAAVGTKAAPGPLYGLKADIWAALAVAVTYADQLEALAA